MRFRVSAFGAFLAGAALLPCNFPGSSSYAQAQSRGRAIEFSVPKNTEAATNLHEFTNKKSEIRTFEADRFRPKSSLEGVLPVMPSASTPAISSKKVRELLDQKKNWIFMNPDDFGSGPTTESIFKVSEFGADGQEKEKGSMVEQFLERQQRKERPDKKKEDPAKERERALWDAQRDSDTRDDDESFKDDPNLPEGVRQSQLFLKKQMSKSEFSSESLDSSARNMLSDFFGGEGKDSQRDSFEKRNDAVSREYHPFSSAPAVSSSAVFESLGLAKTGLVPAQPAATSLDSLTPVRRLDAPESIAPSVSAGLSVPSLPDVNARALNQWNTMAPSLPQFEPAKLTPTMTIPQFPRRQF